MILTENIETLKIGTKNKKKGGGGQLWHAKVKVVRAARVAARPKRVAAARSNLMRRDNNGYYKLHPYL